MEWTAGVGTLGLNQGSCLGLAPKGEAGREANKVRVVWHGAWYSLGAQKREKKIFFRTREHTSQHSNILSAVSSPCPHTSLGATFPKSPQSPEARTCPGRSPFPREGWGAVGGGGGQWGGGMVARMGFGVKAGSNFLLSIRWWCDLGQVTSIFSPVK